MNLISRARSLYSKEEAPIIVIKWRFLKKRLRDRISKISSPILSIGRESFLNTNIPIIAIHLTRPPVEIPDRNELGIASHLDASKGAYIIKNYDSNKNKDGVVIIRGTSSINSLIKILPQIKSDGPNVKIIAAISWELFRIQPLEYQQRIISDIDWPDSMVITNGAISLMKNWISNRVVQDYSLSPDFDNRWRTGGSVDEIIAESKLDSQSLFEGIKRFADERNDRLNRLHQSIPNIK